MDFLDFETTNIETLYRMEDKSQRHYFLSKEKERERVQCQLSLMRAIRMVLTISLLEDRSSNLQKKIKTI